jgi:DNA-binding response OmpR family regulator
MPYPLTSTLLPHDFASVLSGALQQSDFELETCMDGDTALERIRSITPKAVLLDLNLPGALDMDILTRIRADAKLAGTRVILATTNARQVEAFTDEADTVLLKPVSPAQLRELALWTGIR